LPELADLPPAGGAKKNFVALPFFPQAARLSFFGAGGNHDQFKRTVFAGRSPVSNVQQEIFAGGAGDAFKPSLFPVQRMAGPIALAPLPGGPLPAGNGAQEAQREADKVLLSRFAPASVVINSDFEIMQFRGPTGAFLESPPGRATLNLLKMSREGLYGPLRSAVLKARRHQNASAKGIRIRQNGRSLMVDLEVVSLKSRRAESAFSWCCSSPLAGFWIRRRFRKRRAKNQRRLTRRKHARRTSTSCRW